MLTPQANTTVEPEFWVMLPPGVAMINARMMSDRDTLEGRLLDYFEQLDTAVRQFHNAPIGAIALGTTGASYVAGIPRERDAVAALTRKMGVPFITAGLAVVLALNTLKAKRIGIVSPYPAPLTKACIPYWEEHGFKVDGRRADRQPSRPVPSDLFDRGGERAAGPRRARGQEARSPS